MENLPHWIQSLGMLWWRKTELRGRHAASSELAGVAGERQLRNRDRRVNDLCPPCCDWADRTTVNYQGGKRLYVARSYTARLALTWSVDVESAAAALCIAVRLSRALTRHSLLYVSPSQRARHHFSPWKTYDFIRMAVSAPLTCKCWRCRS